VANRKLRGEEEEKKRVLTPSSHAEKVFLFNFSARLFRRGRLDEKSRVLAGSFQPPEAHFSSSDGSRNPTASTHHHPPSRASNCKNMNKKKSLRKNLCISALNHIPIDAHNTTPRHATITRCFLLLLLT